MSDINERLDAEWNNGVAEGKRLAFETMRDTINAVFAIDVVNRNAALRLVDIAQGPSS